MGPGPTANRYPPCLGRPNTPPRHIAILAKHISVAILRSNPRLERFDGLFVHHGTAHRAPSISPNEGLRSEIGPEAEVGISGKFMWRRPRAPVCRVSPVLRCWGMVDYSEAVTLQTKAFSPMITTQLWFIGPPAESNPPAAKIARVHSVYHGATNHTKNRSKRGTLLYIF